MKHDASRILLHWIAHGRAGDKGDTANISVIAYRPEFFPVLVEQITEVRVADAFRHRAPSAVRRYVLPKLGALNFVLEGVLGGGVNQSLNLDTHGKTLGFLLLSLEVEMPAELVVWLQPRVTPGDAGVAPTKLGDAGVAPTKRGDAGVASTRAADADVAATT